MYYDDCYCFCCHYLLLLLKMSHSRDGSGFCFQLPPTLHSQRLLLSLFTTCYSSYSNIKRMGWIRNDGNEWELPSNFVNVSVFKSSGLVALWKWKVKLRFVFEASYLPCLLNLCLSFRSHCLVIVICNYISNGPRRGLKLWRHKSLISIVLLLISPNFQALNWWPDFLVLYVSYPFVPMALLLVQSLTHSPFSRVTERKMFSEIIMQKVDSIPHKFILFTKDNISAVQ